MLAGTHYSDAPPREGAHPAEHVALSLARHLGLRTIETGELEGLLPEDFLFKTPIGEAETLNDVLFFFDGRYV